MDVCGAQAPFIRRNYEEPIRMSHTRQHRPFHQRVIFWGTMSGDGPVALVPISGTMATQKYMTTLREHLVPCLENQPLAVSYVFQHDNA